MLVAALRSTGRPIYAINPLAVDRYRERHTVARGKSDTGDAVVLANILRTDRPVHRSLPADSDLARAIKVLARAQQDAVWDRTRALADLLPPNPRLLDARQATVASCTREGFQAAAASFVAIGVSGRQVVRRTFTLRFNRPYAAVAVAVPATGPRSAANIDHETSTDASGFSSP